MQSIVCNTDYAVQLGQDAKKITHSLQNTFILGKELFCNLLNFSSVETQAPSSRLVLVTARDISGSRTAHQPTVDIRYVKGNYSK